MNAVDDTPWRRALRAYPASWRERHGEAMLGTLLDEAEATGRREPTRGERASLVATGVGMRVTGWMPETVRAAIAAAAAGTGVALAISFALFSGFVAPIDDQPGTLLQPSPALAAAALWSVSFTLIACGAIRAARFALVATAVAGVAAWTVAQAVPSLGPRAITTVTLTLLAAGALLAPVRARIAVTVTAVATTAALVAFHLTFEVGIGTASEGIWLRVLTEEFSGFVAGALWLLALLTAAARAHRIAGGVAAVAVVWTVLWLTRLTMWDLGTGLLVTAVLVSTTAAGVALFRSATRSGEHSRSGASPRARGATALPDGA